MQDVETYNRGRPSQCSLRDCLNSPPIIRWDNDKNSRHSKRPSRVPQALARDGTMMNISGDIVNGQVHNGICTEWAHQETKESSGTVIFCSSISTTYH
jgi:hypothetical protein